MECGSAFNPVVIRQPVLDSNPSEAALEKNENSRWMVPSDAISRECRGVHFYG
jgi:hypothetical protein